MRYEIELLAHNGVIGKNPVEPFAGKTVPTQKDLFPDQLFADERVFTFSHKREETDVTRYCFREFKLGEPSDWAKARAAERGE